MISYRSAKAAVAHATKCIAIDLAPYNIRVNCLTPAHIRTGITTYEMGPVLRYMQPLERVAQPEDVANAVVFLSSDRAAQITGIVMPIDGGTTAGAALCADQADHVHGDAVAGARQARIVSAGTQSGSALRPATSR